MSATLTDALPASRGGPSFDLLAGGAGRLVALEAGAPVDVARFLRHVHGVAQRLPDAPQVLNLCDDRYRFLVGFAAALARGRTTLLPPSRAPGVLVELLERHPSACLLGDCSLVESVRAEAAPPTHLRLGEALPEAEGPMPRIDAGLLAAIGFTSGSSGPPKAQYKFWGGFCASTALNAATLARIAGRDATLVATVPPQHMYGMEFSVLMPLRGEVAVHGSRPFFPADIAAALQAVPAPRVLVTTPVHLRTLVASGETLPPIAAIVSATAPLSQELAQAAERAFGTRVLEFFGSTETCVVGHRFTAHEQEWTHYPGVRFSHRPDGALVEADWLPGPVVLQDVIESLPERRFRLAGRASDHLEIAGKRASLAELTRRVLAIAGVQDAVVFQPESEGPVQRVAALVVAPGLDEAHILAALRATVDPVFLPRPLRLVDALPRNATGKLARQALLDALRG
jgi:acyl-coenzyme A synthetase/AMP-(fatty) acid ligase